MDRFPECGHYAAEVPRDLTSYESKLEKATRCTELDRCDTEIGVTVE